MVTSYSTNLIALLKQVIIHTTTWLIIFHCVQVVASTDWPEVTKYRALVSTQAHREEIVQDLYNKREDPKRGVIHGGMIRLVSHSDFFSYLFPSLLMYSHFAESIWWLSTNPLSLNLTGLYSTGLVDVCLHFTIGVILIIVNLCC